MELPLTHPEYYEEMGIKPPKGVILYGAPGTGESNTPLFVSFIKDHLITKTYFDDNSQTEIRVTSQILIHHIISLDVR